MNIEQKAINTLKINGVAAINKANSGHPGIVLGAANIIHTLYTRHIRVSTNNHTWINRDRFVLSAGHGSALLYSILEKIGYITIEDLKEFRQWGSNTPGHPEYKHTLGVDATTGPLGQGIAMAVGLAVSEAHLNAKFKEVSHFTYVLCGDGDLQEGVSYESMSYAGKNKLNKLIVLYDSNDIQLDAEVSKSFYEDIKMRVESMGWNYIKVQNNNIEEIDAAIKKSKKINDKPSFIEIKTIIGEGATAQGTNKLHGAPIGNDINNLKMKLGWTDDEFEVSQEVRKFYQKTIIERGNQEFQNFRASKGLNDFLKTSDVKIAIDINKNIATRSSSEQVIKYLSQKVPQWIGGSADLSCSTKAKGSDGDFSNKNRLGRNMMFGVREFAMASIANGMALHSNFKPFVSTFLIFSDYMKPAIRLAALMKLPVTYVMTHDSVCVGEDGPTHQPIEQYAMLRAIPNINVLRPADEKEVIGSYEIAINEKTKPTVIGLTRQNIVSQNNTFSNKVKKGAYVVHKGNNETTIIATGSELSLAIKIGETTDSTVISMPSINLFEQQDNKYKESILNKYNKTLTLEAASTFGWAKYGKYNFGINRFGTSAQGDKIYSEFGFTEENLIKVIKNIK